MFISWVGGVWQEECLQDQTNCSKPTPQLHLEMLKSMIFSEIQSFKMASISKSSHPFPLIFVSFGFVLHTLSAISESDFRASIFNVCADEIFSHPTYYRSQTLSSLAQVLVSQSSQTRFFRAADGNEEFSIEGLFQCRGDLSEEECRKCVIQLGLLSNALCPSSLPVRIQLEGCYSAYEAQRVELENPNNGVVHKICGERESGNGWSEEKLAQAFAALEDGMSRSEDGFYEGVEAGVEVKGQCQGNLGGCGCGECLGKAMEIAQQCGNSLWGKIYLDECFFSFSFHPNNQPQPPSGQGSNNGWKSAAIVVGGASALGLILISLLFFKSFFNKKEDD